MKVMKSNLTTAMLTALLSVVGFCPTMNADQTNLTVGHSEKKTPTQLVDVSKADKLIAEKKVVVLDVRTPAEFAHGHIAGATNLDFRDAEFKAKVAKLDKNQPYLVNCAAGGRSAKACEAMGQLDFKVLYDLQGGMSAWEKAGKPVEK
ncbi:MAG: Rhodanese-related sulfurtransferase [Pedosphaera sp.]|nr:Rhodanese-related sulfurtransferase [Pedosphaera sp.]